MFITFVSQKPKHLHLFVQNPTLKMSSLSTYQLTRCFPPSSSSLIILPPPTVKNSQLSLMHIGKPSRTSFTLPFSLPKVISLLIVVISIRVNNAFLQCIIISRYHIRTLIRCCCKSPRYVRFLHFTLSSNRFQ